jgi:hypothetical protein
VGRRIAAAVRERGNARAFLCGLARAETRRFWLLSALRAHTKVPHKTVLLWKTLRALKCPGRARTVQRATNCRHLAMTDAASFVVGRERVSLLTMTDT